MPRGLTIAQKAELSGKLVRPTAFVDVEFSTDPIRAWDGVGTINVSGITYHGVGQFGAIEGVQNERSMRSNNVIVGIIGVPRDAINNNILAKVAGRRYQGIPMKISMGLMDPDFESLIASPWLMWRGVADVISYQIGESISITLSGEHYSSHMRRINGLRVSHESHAQRTGFNNDIFMRFVNRLTGTNTEINP